MKSSIIHLWRKHYYLYNISIVNLQLNTFGIPLGNLAQDKPELLQQDAGKAQPRP